MARANYLMAKFGIIKDTEKTNETKTILFRLLSVQFCVLFTNSTRFDALYSSSKFRWSLDTKCAKTESSN